MIARATAVASRLSRIFFAVGIAAALSLSSCGGAQKKDASPRGVLRFNVTPAEATVEIDETRLGPASMLAKQGVMLLVGQHRVVVTAENFLSEHRLVDIREGEVATVELTLTPTPE